MRKNAEGKPVKMRDTSASPRSSPRKSLNADSSPQKSRNVDSSPRKSRDVDSSPQKSRNVDSSPRKSLNVLSPRKSNNLDAPQRTSRDVPRVSSGKRKLEQVSKILFKINAVWTEYPTDVYEALRKSYMKKDEIVELVVVSDPEVAYMRYYTKYFIDWVKLEQTNAFTNKTRKLRLVNAGDVEENKTYPTMKGALARIKTISSIPKKSVFFADEAPVGGEYKRTVNDCHRILTKMQNSWVEYPDDVLGALQKAYVDGHDIVEFVILSDPEVSHMKFYSKYFVDFSEMKQANSYTEKSRAVRFLKKGDKGVYEKMKGVLAKDPTAIQHLNSPSVYNMGDLTQKSGAKKSGVEVTSWDESPTRGAAPPRKRSQSKSPSPSPRSQSRSQSKSPSASRGQKSQGNASPRSNKHLVP